MGKARDKGTRGENETVDYFVDAGFPRADPEDPASVGVERLQGGFESHDIHFKNMAVDWVVESKFRKPSGWRLFLWVRKMRERAQGRPWVIVGIHGARNTADGKAFGSVAIMDARTAAELIEYWETEHDWRSR